MDEQGVKTLQLRLNTLANTRKSMARLLRMRLREELDREVFRDLCYGFSAYCQIWKLEQDSDFEKRLETVENRMDERRNEYA